MKTAMICCRKNCQKRLSSTAGYVGRRETPAADGKGQCSRGIVTGRRTLRCEHHCADLRRQYSVLVHRSLSPPDTRNARDAANTLQGVFLRHVSLVLKIQYQSLRLFYGVILNFCGFFFFGSAAFFLFLPTSCARRANYPSYVGLQVPLWYICLSFITLSMFCVCGGDAFPRARPSCFLTHSVFGIRSPALC